MEYLSGWNDVRVSAGGSADVQFSCNEMSAMVSNYAGEKITSWQTIHRLFASCRHNVHDLSLPSRDFLGIHPQYTQLQKQVRLLQMQTSALEI